MTLKSNKKKKNFTRREFIVASAVTSISFSMSLYGCSKKHDAKPSPQPGTSQLKITNVSIPANMNVKPGSDITITAKGFAEGDKIIFTSANGTAYAMDVKAVTDQYATITIPESMPDNKYTITVTRGIKSAMLGSSTVNLVFNANIPDKNGMTVKGTMYAAGVGLANVVVSDGINVTKTDNDGIYYLPSAKKAGYVFVSFPENYEVASEGSAPLFFKRLTTAATEVEVKDFALTPVNNNKHVVLALADMHLANRNNDIQQFQNGFLADANQLIQSYKNSGTKVYALTLGDMTWDGYWYTNNYALPEYLGLMNKINTQVFSAMGNHDNDPYVANDWNAENKFRSVIGPTYYSFNLGKVHYIVLDDTQYINTSGSNGNVGSRNYNATIVSDQMEWLKKDLATIQDKSTPIAIIMHIQLNGNPQLNTNGTEKSTLRLSNAAEFMSALNGFSKVHILSGHTHINYAYENSASLMEHNTAAVCATWWWTGKNGYAGNHICKDGSPGGYGVWEVENADLKWQYKSIGYEQNYQFRAYDLNKVHITAAAHAPKSTDTALAKYAAEYATANNNNEILINVWGYDTKWKVEVTEDGNPTPLTVTRVYTLDPLHIISYSALRLNAGATPTEDFVTTKTAHMFKAKASRPDSTVIIKITDRFGRVYTENMVRPKAFTYTMR